MFSRQSCLLGLGCLAILAGSAQAQDKPKPDFPKFTDVAKNYTKVVSSADGSGSLYTIYLDKKRNQLLAELPRGYERQKHFFAMTVAKGDMWAGLQSGDRYVYWKRFDKRLALIEPELRTRTTGDRESRDSVSRHFTDRVLLDVPIVCLGPSGQPVIDLDSLLVGNMRTFFPGDGNGANARLATIAQAKAFPKNIEVEVEVPVAGGRLKAFHYSISLIPDKTGYKPRVADDRIGYFTTAYRDLGKFQEEEKYIQYINRWHLEKADSKLKMSPPKQPITFYIEHTVPVRYRRWVRDGIMYWNKAFEQVGIVGAVEVHYQDAATGAHMDKDPEDVRYNFIRWLSNDISTAIGPSRVHPLTGQILDADVVLTDGWIRVFNDQFHELMPEIAMEGFAPDTLAWLHDHPEWDPRVRLAPPSQREFMTHERRAHGPEQYGGHPASQVDPVVLGDDEYDGLYGRLSQCNGMCLASHGKAMDMAMMRMHLSFMDWSREGDDADPNADVIDGVPDWFVGPLLADLVAHEVGHTLGLRHNFKASALYTLDEINSEEMKGKKPFTASVMDYNPININFESGEIQGDYAMIDIGPYDMWAIEYGYTFGKTDDIVARVAEPELQFGTDEDTWGPDPYARRYDFSKNPIDYAKNQIRAIGYYRDSMLDRFVDDGEPWGKVRAGYQLTLMEQTKMLSMMSNWIGGAHVYRDHKGDPNGRAPLEVADVAKQREAIEFVIEHALTDEAFGLSREVLRHMTIQRNGGGGFFAAGPDWPVHDRVMGIQASALTQIMNPTTLARVYDNEFRVAGDEDALTLPELLTAVVETVYDELGTDLNGATFTNREPMISSLRRNLQSEMTDRLIALTVSGRGMPRAFRTLALHHLRDVNDQVESLLEQADGGQVDDYTIVHLEDINERIMRALNAVQVAP